MSLDLFSAARRWKRKVTASGSPLRYLGKYPRALGNRVFQPELFRDVARTERELPSRLAETLGRLRQDGLAAAGPEWDPALLAELGTFANARLADPKLDELRTVLRKFMIQLSHVSDLHSDHVLVRFALQDSILQLVTAYLGEVPYLSSVQIFQSLSTGQTDKWGESQLWHLDYEDSTTVKVWVYLTDVPDVEHGPFTYLPLDASRKVKNRLFPGRLSDEALAEQGVADRAAQIIGPRLATAFYVDSSLCYHLGSRVHPGRERVVYEATFVTHSSLYPIESGIRVGSDMSPLQRRVLTR